MAGPEPAGAQEMFVEWKGNASVTTNANLHFQEHLPQPSVLNVILKERAGRDR